MLLLVFSMNFETFVSLVPCPAFKAAFVEYLDYW